MCERTASGLSAMAILLLTSVLAGGQDIQSNHDSGSDSGNVVSLMIRDALSCQCRAFDIYQNLPTSISAFEDSTGLQVQVTRQPGDGYRERLFTALDSNEPPDVFWVPSDIVPAIAERRSAITLDERIERQPAVMDGLPAWVQEQFKYTGKTYGIPLGNNGDHQRHGYAISTVAHRRGKVDIAFELIAHLRNEVPPRDRPDLAIEKVTFSTDTPEAVDKGQELLANVVVHNIGEAEGKDITLTLSIDGQRETRRRQIDTLGVGQTAEFQFALPTQIAGDHWLEATLDPNDVVSESSKLNNRVLESFRVVPFAGAAAVPPTPNGLSAPFCIDQKAYRTDVRGMGPKVAFDGTNFLVVYAKQTPLQGNTYNHRIRGVRISPSGQILDANGFVITSKIGKYDTFNVAFDGNNYLVVWEENLADVAPSFNYTQQVPSVIAGARVSPGGGVLDTTPIIIDGIQVSTTKYVGHEAPEVVFDGTDYIVVYRDGWGSFGLPQEAIYAKRVSKAGNVIPGKIKLVQLGTVNAWGLQRVAYNGGEGYLVFIGFNTLTKNYLVQGARLTYAGGVLTASASQSIAPSTIQHPFGWPNAASAATKNYLTVWEDARSKKQHHPDIHGAIVKTAGSIPIAHKGALVAGTVDEFPAVAFDGKNYTIAYAHYSGCKSYVGAIRVDSDGVPSAAKVFQTEKAELVSELDLAFGTTNGLIAYENFNPPSTYNGPDYSTAICVRLIDKTP